MYLKITNKAENHNNLQYHDGLIQDILPFQKKGSCVPGGIYFSDEKHILEFLNYGVYIREVQIPEDADFVEDPSGNKYRASKIILKERKDLRELNTWKWLVQNGVDIHANNNFALIELSEVEDDEFSQLIYKNIRNKKCTDKNADIRHLEYLVLNGKRFKFLHISRNS